MSQHVSPFGKHKADLITTKSNKIFTFAREDPFQDSAKNDEIIHDSNNKQRESNGNAIKDSNPIRTASPQIYRPRSRTSSFYNGYCSPISCDNDMVNTRDHTRDTAVVGDVPRAGSVWQDNTLKRSDSLYSSSDSPRGGGSDHNSRNGSNVNRSNSPHLSRSDSPHLSRSDSPNSPRRSSQSDCTDTNCLNLFHEHNLRKSPRSNYSDWGKSPRKSISRTSTPTTMTSSYELVTSRNEAVTSREEGALSRSSSPSKDPSLDRLSQAIRDMDKLYNVGLDCDYSEMSRDLLEVSRDLLVVSRDGMETLTGLGESVNVTELDKLNMLKGCCFY